MPTIICNGKVVELIRPTIPRPTECPVCKGPVGPKQNVDGSPGTEIECKNPDCEGKSLKRIENWITKNNILGIGDTILAAMIEELDMRSPADLYRVIPEQISALIIGGNPYGDVRAKAIYNEIQKTRKMTLENFLGSLSIRHLGRRRVELIREKVPGQMDSLADWRGDKLLTLDAGVTNIAPEILEDVKKHSSVIDDLLQYVEIVEGKPATEAAPVGLKFSFVLTGTMSRPRSQIVADIIRAGHEVKDTITKGVDYLVQADPSSVGSKSQKALKLGTKIISESRLMEMLIGRL